MYCVLRTMLFLLGMSSSNTSESNSQDISSSTSEVDFKLIKVIGRGSFAKVLMVEHIKTKNIYAMKVIKKCSLLENDVSI